MACSLWHKNENPWNDFLEYASTEQNLKTLTFVPKYKIVVTKM
jgi:hypothetical protein